MENQQGTPMMSEPYVTRREVDMLKTASDIEHARISTRLESMDDHGTRGVGTMQLQIVDLVKDVTELKTEMNARFEAHQKVHDQDHTERVAGRRWLIGTALAGLVAMVAVIGLLVDLVRTVHG